MGADSPDRGLSRLNDRVEQKIEDRIDRFSITVLGYDRSSDDPKPSEMLDWVRERMDQDKTRQARMGAAVTAIVTAILGAIAWPILQYLAHAFGH